LPVSRTRTIRGPMPVDATRWEGFAPSHVGVLPGTRVATEYTRYARTHPASGWNVGAPWEDNARGHAPRARRGWHARRDTERHRAAWGRGEE
jgi:hypothetical protein